MKYIIIGGVAGGATVAARLRRLDEQAEIILFERGDYVSYANCGLPYYIGDVIREREKLFVQTAQGFINRFNIDIRTGQEVIRIDPENHLVEIKELQTGRIYTEQYTKLVLSPGAEPLRPGIKGINQKHIFTLRNIPDTDAIKQYVTASKPKSALVIGGGFIGLEMAENLHTLGVEVGVVEMANQVMAPLDYSMASIVHQHLEAKSVQLILNDGVDFFDELPNGQIAVHLKSGRKIITDMVILSIGVRPETILAKEAALKIGKTGGIAVNEYMQTSAADIYALGDATEINHLVTGKPAMIPLAGPANKQGRIVANNIVLGNKFSYEGAIGTSIAKVFDVTVAATGANAKLLQREGIAYQSSYTHGSSHASYYPGAVPLAIKILFDPTSGRLLGAQVIGFDGVDKRIDLFAQVVRAQGTIYDLIAIEHAYAPPFSSAKDPVNMAGFVADNILSKRVHVVSWRKINDRSSDTLLIDVRTADEFALGSIAGAINIPVDDLRKRMDTLSKDVPIILFCAVGLRGYLAYRILDQHGFTQIANLSGGYKTYSAATSEVKQSPSANNSSINKPMKQGKSKIIHIDACGLQCPGPVMQLKKEYEQLEQGEQLSIKATDQGFASDVSAWCNMTGATLVNVSNTAGIVEALIEKGEKKPACTLNSSDKDNKTLIVFSDDLDKALASFVIANGAASTGKKVTLFFTFWGLSVIKKHKSVNVKKDLLGTMFGWMLPNNSKDLSLSKMNMGGLGGWMMRLVMKRKRVESLESLIQMAIDNNVEMIACTMSMDVMGVKKEELMDHVTLGGVAAYLERAEQANVNLFI